jgi:hypothetical protein
MENLRISLIGDPAVDVPGSAVGFHHVGTNVFYYHNTETGYKSCLEYCPYDFWNYVDFAGQYGPT